ncbi:MAG: hypothetical protein WAO83_01650 [Fuerstiella sp.]
MQTRISSSRSRSTSNRSHSNNGSRAIGVQNMLSMLSDESPQLRRMLQNRLECVMNQREAANAAKTPHIRFTASKTATRQTNPARKTLDPRELLELLSTFAVREVRHA